MNEEIKSSGSGRALLLITNERLFTGLKNVLESGGWKAENSIAQGQDCQIAFVDRNYHEAGTTEYLKNHGWKRKMICLTVTESEVFKISSPSVTFAERMGDILVVRQSEIEKPALAISVRWGDIQLQDYLEKILRHKPLRSTPFLQPCAA